MGTFAVDPVEDYVRLFRAKADEMGKFPDKVIINALTGTAKRHREDKSQAITNLLKSMIMDPAHPASHKLPICFLVDSIVKNINEPYADLFEEDLVRWFCYAYDVVDDKSKKALGRVVATWEVQSVFSADKRKELQRYMLNSTSSPPDTGSRNTAAPTNASVAVQPPPSARMPTPPPAVTPPPAPIILPPPVLAPISAPVAVAPPAATVQPVATAQPVAAAPAVVAAPPLPPLPPPPPPQTVASAAPAVPGIPPDIQAMINVRMKALLDQQLRELGETSNMSLEDLWRTNAELAQGFQLVAQAQVHEQLGLPPPPAPAVALAAPAAAQQALPQPPPPLPPAAHRIQPSQPSQSATSPSAPQPQVAIQLPLGAPPPWAARAPARQDLGRAVQVANEVVAGARAALDASVRGDSAGGQVQAAEAAGKAAILTCLLGGEAAGWTDGVGVHIADLDPLDVRSLARGDPAAVRRLYGEGFPFWCKQDGTRFAHQVQLDAHMDLLFRRKRARREQKGLISREWYCTEEQWLTDFGRLRRAVNDEGDGKNADGGKADGGVDGEDEDAIEDVGAKPVSCVPADDRFSRCRICGNRLEMFFDNEEEEWMYSNACYIDVRGSSGGGGGGGIWEDEDDLGEGANDPSGEDAEALEGEGGERAAGDGSDRLRQIIVHETCLDGSGLREKDEITWKDLMPGTPRERKTSTGDVNGDSTYFGDGVGEDEEGHWNDANGSSGGGEGVKREAEQGRMEEGADGRDSDGVTGEGDEPPLKRVKAEDQPREAEETVRMDEGQDGATGEGIPGDVGGKMEYA